MLDFDAACSIIDANPKGNILTLLDSVGWSYLHDLRGGDWRFVDFRNLDLRGANLRNCRLYGAQFDGAQVAGADFRGAMIERSTLHQAVDWRDAELDTDQRSILSFWAILSRQVNVDVSEALSVLDQDNKLSEREYVTLMHAADTFAQAQKIFDHMSKAGLGASKYALTTLIDKAPSEAIATQIFGNFARQNLAPDRHATNALLSRAEDEASARRIFSEITKTTKPDIYTYNTLLSKMEYYETAEDVIAQMISEGFVPNSISLNPFIWKARSYSGAKVIFDMIDSPRTADINALVSHANWRELQYDVPKVLAAHSDHVDSITFNLLISRCDRLSDGQSIVALMRELGLPRDLYTLFNLLKLVPTGGFDQAIDLILDLAQDDVAIAKWDVARKLVRISGQTVKATSLIERSNSPGEAIYGLTQEFSVNGLPSALLPYL